MTYDDTLSDQELRDLRTELRGRVHSVGPGTVRALVRRIDEQEAMLQSADALAKAARSALPELAVVGDGGVRYPETDVIQTQLEKALAAYERQRTK